jgi:hypothetical protein
MYLRLLSATVLLAVNIPASIVERCRVQYSGYGSLWRAHL